MSWRVLFATLLVALGAAAWGGIQLGDWLVAHAPKASPVPGQEGDASQQPVLDANGKPYLAQPPQPRVDGTLGVPDKPGGQAWTVPTVSLFDTTTDPSVRMSRDNITMDEARDIAASSDVPLPTGPSDVTTLDLQDMTPVPGVTPVPVPPPPGQQPYPTAPPAVAQVAPGAAPARNTAWQDALRRDLAHCATQGFFERPTCSWNARNKYCDPNHAWGTIAECPRRPE